MVDCGDQMQLTQAEFLEAAQQCMAIERDSRSEVYAQDVRKALQDLSSYMSRNHVRVFYGGAFDVAVIWGLPPPLLLGVYSVRLLTRTTSLQRGPLEAPIAPFACS